MARSPSVSLSGKNSHLQEGREEPHERFREPFAERPFQPGGRQDALAVFRIVEEYLLHLQGELALVDECIDLEVVLQAAEIHVGGTDAAHHIVAQDEFGV